MRRTHTHTQRDRQTLSDTIPSPLAETVVTCKTRKRDRDQRKAALCCHLANATDLLTSVLRTIASGWIETTVVFFAVCGAKFTRLCQQRRGRDRSLQRRFPNVDILFRSGDIRDRSEKSSEIAQKSTFSAPIFWREDPQILDLVFKIATISDHVANFLGDRPRDRVDLALNRKRKKRKKRNKQQQNIRAALRYRNGRP